MQSLCIHLRIWCCWYKPDCLPLKTLAKKGNCLSVDNIDSSRTALQSGKSNYGLNGFSFNPRDFVSFTTKEFCRQFAKRSRNQEKKNERRKAISKEATESGEAAVQPKLKQQRRYDLVIIDPSPPSKTDDTKTADQRLQTYYTVNFNYSLAIVADGGVIFMSCHCKVWFKCVQLIFTGHP